MPPWPFSSSTSTSTSSTASTPPSRSSAPIDRNGNGNVPLLPPPAHSDPFKASPLSSEVFNDSATSQQISPRRAHANSLSSTLPSLFGRKKPPPPPEEHASKSSPSSDGYMQGLGSPKRKGSKDKANEPDYDSGKCATCDSKVKWPRGTMQYRCGTCLMINDLRILQPKPRCAEGQDTSDSKAEDHTSTGINSNVTALTIERTRALIDRCIESYLEDRSRSPLMLQEITTSPPHSPLPLPARPRPPRDPRYHERLTSPYAASPTRTSPSPNGNTSPASQRNGPRLLARPNANKADPRTALGGAATSSTSRPLAGASSPVAKAKNPRAFDRTTHPARRPPPPPVQLLSNIVASTAPHSALPSQANVDVVSAERPQSSQFDEGVDDGSPSPKSIFKPVEEYLVRTFATHQCLNFAFQKPRPKARSKPPGEDDERGRRPNELLEKTRPIDAPMSELDAKTLLLGSEAENGLWWTGRDGRADAILGHNRRERSAGNTEDIVQSRTPRIDFAEVDKWYSLIIRAGEEWNHKWRPDANANVERIEIEHALAQGRAHLHRTLLKASESLLKRPGRPLKSPNDIRFLLILLANPLLFPATKSPLATDAARTKTAHNYENTLDKNGAAISVEPGKQSTSIWEQGYAFGVIKRILGLMSNLPNDSHRHLTSWLARYKEHDFRQLIDMIQGFVTHRLGRQAGKKQKTGHAEAGFIPGLSGTSAGTSAHLHAALGLTGQVKGGLDRKAQLPVYSTDWQMKAAAKVMALMFAANKNFQGEVAPGGSPSGDVSPVRKTKRHGQLLSTPYFYNMMADYGDLIADFEAWESAQGQFSFCQYPFLLPVGAKIRIMEYDARRQMELKAREAFFNSILRNKALEQYLTLKVRRECLVEDSLKTISEVVGAGQEEIKKGLKVQFVDEEGVDAGGLRKEWFLLLSREIFEPQHGLFVYDEDSQLCYFNPHSFETSDQYFLVGALLGLAIYNATILDIALPPFTFKKLLAAGPGAGAQKSAYNRTPIQYSLSDLAEYRPSLANGFRQLLEYDGDVEKDLSLDFVAETDKYGSKQQVPLCPDGASRPVTNASRQEFVDLYVRYLLDGQVARQFEPFKRGFFTVCGGNALSLFQPEEIELLIRGSDEPLDVPSLKAVAVYENWRRGERKVDNPAEEVSLIKWFWEFFEQSDPKDQRKLLGFITASDRIPAMGATSLIIKIAFAGKDYMRYPIARTCFNLLLLYKYRTKEELVEKLWRAVCESEGFGLK